MNLVLICALFTGFDMIGDLPCMPDPETVVEPFVPDQPEPVVEEPVQEKVVINNKKTKAVKPTTPVVPQMECNGEMCKFPIRPLFEKSAAEAKSEEKVEEPKAVEQNEPEKKEEEEEPASEVAPVAVEDIILEPVETPKQEAPALNPDEYVKKSELTKYVKKSELNNYIRTYILDNPETVIQVMTDAGLLNASAPEKKTALPRTDTPKVAQTPDTKLRLYVYTRQGCQLCTYLLRDLRSRQLPFEVIEIAYPQTRPGGIVGYPTSDLVQGNRIISTFQGQVPAETIINVARKYEVR